MAYTITAADTSLPNLGYQNPFFFGTGMLNTYPGFMYYPRHTTWTQNNSFGGQYSAVIGSNSTYKLSSQFALYTTLYTTSGTTTTAGVVTWSPPDGASFTMSGDRNFEFNVPAFPGMITIVGQVSGAIGTAGSVMAKSDEILDADGNVIPGLSYFTHVGTNAAGNYLMQVLPGRNYQLYFETNPMLIIQ